ncbi:hypothetical protein ZMO02_14210 [Zymomonas mobilis subsp. pomaceae]|nr:hypothetical protein ZMO02_14210 [Zymomonas mobilis subsp. pomaceae]
MMTSDRLTLLKNQTERQWQKYGRTPPIEGLILEKTAYPPRTLSKLSRILCYLAGRKNRYSWKGKLPL